MAFQGLWRLFGQFPKLFITIAKRCSSTILHLLRYLFRWIASVRRWKQTNLLQNGAEHGLTLTASSTNGTTETKVEKDHGIRPATILCSEVVGASGGSVLHPTQAISRTATSTVGRFPDTTMRLNLMSVSSPRLFRVQTRSTIPMSSPSC
ncbi:hypothetical protein EV401DRAFT_296808 [Pisolithus croceorrhizus]|nr:hypothetical protein EV401DRAFT_296808 [Pisolithus croceorrhizus]